jgi:hypothetical protein
VTVQRGFAGAIELVLVRLQARADFELIRNIVLAKAPRVEAAGAIFGVSSLG